MSSVSHRGSPTAPLLGFTAAAAVEAVRLFLHASSGPRDALLEILALVATGLTDAQIAQYLFLSPRTVSKHLQSIYAKLNINSRSSATRVALEHGLV